MTDQVRIRADALDWREIEGEVVALDLAASKYIALNRTGTAIWSDLLEGATQAQLIERLVERYGVEPETAQVDLDAFLQQLAERNLLEQ